MAEFVKNNEGKHRYGKIDTKRWQELQKMGISRNGMYILTELLVGRFRNPLGAFYIPFPCMTLAKYTGMTSDEIQEILHELQRYDLLEFDKENEVLFIKEHWRHNQISSIKHAMGARTRVLDLPDNNLFPSMAKLFEQACKEARAYDMENPPKLSLAQNPTSDNNKYSTTYERYFEVLKAIKERLMDKGINTPMDDTPINIPMDTTIDTTDTETYTETDIEKDTKDIKGLLQKTDDSKPFDLHGILSQREKSSLVPSSDVVSKNWANFMEAVKKYGTDFELQDKAKLFIHHTCKVLDVDTWGKEITNLIHIPDREGFNNLADDLELEELDVLIKQFFETDYGSEVDHNIVLFNQKKVMP